MTVVSRATGSQDPRDLMTGEKQQTVLTPGSRSRVGDTDPTGSRAGETRAHLRTADTTTARPGAPTADGTMPRSLPRRKARRKAEARAPRRTTARATERALRRTTTRGTAKTTGKDTARAAASRTGARGRTTPTVAIRTPVTSRRTTGSRPRAIATGRRRRPGSTGRRSFTRSVRCTCRRSTGITVWRGGTCGDRLQLRPCGCSPRRL